MESTISSLIATNASESIKQNQFLSLNYWFGNPGTSDVLGLVVFGFLAFLLTITPLLALILAYLSKKLNPPQKKFFEKFGWYLLPFGLIGWLLSVFRFFAWPWVSIRALWVVWLVALSFVGWRLFRHYSQKLPQSKAQYESYLIKKRYFSTKKKK